MHFKFNTFFSESHIMYDIIRKTIVQWDRPQMTIHMEYLHWMLDKYGYRHTQNITVSRTCLCYIYEYTVCLLSILLHKILPEALSDVMTFVDNACVQWTLLQQHQLHPELAVTISTHIKGINTENQIIYFFIYLLAYLTMLSAAQTIYH
jgi:hypothetical protein